MHPAVSVFGPDESDWLVTLVLKTGASQTRRITPGKVGEEQALQFALAVAGVSPREVDAWSIRRVGDRRLAPPDDPFAQMLKRRMRT